MSKLPTKHRNRLIMGYFGRVTCWRMYKRCTELNGHYVHLLTLLCKIRY